MGPWNDEIWIWAANGAITGGGHGFGHGSVSGRPHWDAPHPPGGQKTASGRVSGRSAASHGCLAKLVFGGTVPVVVLASDLAGSVDVHDGAGRVASGESSWVLGVTLNPILSPPGDTILDMYEYQSTIMNVVDGDTLDVTVDLGFRMRRDIRLRLSGIDTHETYGVDKESEEYKLGKTETRFVESWVESGRSGDSEWPFVVRTEKTGKFGRYLAEVERRSDDAILNQALLSEFGDPIRS